MRKLILSASALLVVLLVTSSQLVSAEEKRRSSFFPVITFQFEKFSIELGGKDNGRGGVRLNVPQQNLQIELDTTLNKQRRMGVKIKQGGRVWYDRDHLLSEPPPPPLPADPEIDLGESSGFDDDDFGSGLDKEFDNKGTKKPPARSANVPPAPE